MKKYEITDIAHPNNLNLHRIRAVTDLTEDVLAAMLGGYEEDGQVFSASIATEPKLTRDDYACKLQQVLLLYGVNVRRLHQTDLRAMLGYVPQKGVLFTGDILSNLEFGGDVSEADAIRAAATAQAEDFIWSRPHHFLTPVAQGGANVSGGQRQRLSIARAIARHPQVYLFDDSFSALDYQTDAALRQALAKQTHDATVIIVAQRLSTILHADQILVLDGGRIVGRGTHSALLRSCETYREIALSQLSAAELGEEG